MHLFIYWIKAYGYLGIFSLLTLGMFGLPVPDETILAFTGFLLAKDYLYPVPAVLAAFGGSVCGITLNYVVGHTVGLLLLQKYGHYLHITPQRLERAHQWFEDYGPPALFFGYFFPGLRHLTAFTAGISKLEYRHFAPYAYAGGFLWVCGFISLGYFVGEKWVKMVPRVRAYLWKGMVVLAILALLFYLGQRLRIRQRQPQASDRNGRQNSCGNKS